MVLLTSLVHIALNDIKRTNKELRQHWNRIIEILEFQIENYREVQRLKIELV